MPCSLCDIATTFVSLIKFSSFHGGQLMVQNEWITPSKVTEVLIVEFTGIV